MRIRRILAIATGLELVGIAALAAFTGLFSFRADKYDVANNLAPLWLIVAVLGGLISWFALGPRKARTGAMVATAFAVIVFGGAIGWELAHKAAQSLFHPPARGPVLKVVTFNASGDTFDPDLSRQALVSADADVVLLQEPAQLLAQPATLLAKYPHLAECHVVAACELAILSKRPIRRSRAVVKRRGGVGWGDVEFLWAETTAPDGRPVTVATTHYEWQVQGGQRKQRRLLDQHAQALPQDNLVLGGDFNLTPWTRAMREQDRRLRPLTRRTRAVFSWPAHIPRLFRPVYVPLVPIDHVYAGPAWKTVSARRLPAAASDHYPVMVILAR